MSRNTQHQQIANGIWNMANAKLPIANSQLLPSKRPEGV